jgi:glycosyltransferase involved in cell wall biosynthesis
VIPCYNQAHFLAEAIESVKAQTFRDVEVLVVDDGSTDDIGTVLDAFPWVRSIRQENRGLAAARNTGIAHSRGDFLIFLDADDRLLPHAAETGARLLMADPSLGFVAGHSRFITGAGVPLPTQQPVRGSENAYLSLLRRNSIRNPAIVMFRRRVLAPAGGFDSRVDACADYAIYLRISRDHPVGFHSAVVAEYRKHGHNMSNDAALMLRQLQLVMREQRPHLVTPARQHAYREGCRNMRQYYGDRVATQIRERLRTRSAWRKTCADVATLIWSHPGGAAEHGWRKVLCWWRGEVTSAQPT